MGFREDALAAYEAAVQAERDREAEALSELLLAAREACRPALTDVSSGKLLLDPLKALTEAHVDQRSGLVVLTTPDGIAFGVRDGVVQLITMVDEAWTEGPVVTSAAEVGALLAAAS